MMIEVYNHLLSKVFRIYFHSQNVIGSLGIGIIPTSFEQIVFFFPAGKPDKDCIQRLGSLGGFGRRASE